MMSYHRRNAILKITFSGVSKVFEPDIAALRDINLEINKGEFVYVIKLLDRASPPSLRIITRSFGLTRGSVRANKVNLREMRKADIPHYRRDGAAAQISLDST